VERIQNSRDGLELICRDLKLTADMVLVGIGVTPNSQLAETANLELSVNKSIAVDRNLKTSDENIFSAGDCADAFHVVTSQRTWIPLALRANRAGWAVADNVCGKDVALDGVAGTSVFRVFDLEVARTGLNMEQAGNFGFEPVANTIKSRSKAHSHPGNTVIQVNMIGDKKSGLLLGAQMVGKEGVAHRINAAAVALHARMTVAQFGQTDLAYAPPFGPTWDPTLTAANQLLKKM
jgi:NADPH-dependent 2,4-dienoyl-CoA reductase/sulfur reductase-like enzyme